MNDQLIDDLIRDEGLRLKPYKDSEGILTIGIGRNLEDRGITEDEARYLLDNDLQWVYHEVLEQKPFVEDLPGAVQNAIYNMCFNMGTPRLMKFKKMWAALEAKDYAKAADEALDSLWARQVGARAQRIAEAIRNA